MKIAGMMRVKNEARWIRGVIDSMRKVCDAGIYVFDDHSTDETRAIAADADAHVLPSPFIGLDETRDKNHLTIEIMKRCDPDWILHIDGDEMLEAAGAAEIRELVESSQPGVEAYFMLILYLWDQEDRVRVDGVYGACWRARLFRTRSSDLLFHAGENGKSSTAHLHCGNIPRDLNDRGAFSKTRIKHFGYLDRETRLEKFAFYSRIDPDNVFEDRYRHMIQGDVPEVPAEESLRWAGPLQTAAYGERT